MATRKEIFEEYEKLERRRFELDGLIMKSYRPKLDKLIERKDRDGLKKLLEEIPKPCYFNLMIFQALRELDEHKK